VSDGSDAAANVDASSALPTTARHAGSAGDLRRRADQRANTVSASCKRVDQPPADVAGVASRVINERRASGIVNVK
jgi:hypothetical protein